MSSVKTCAQSINSALDRLLGGDGTVHLLGEDIRDPYGGAFKITKGLSSKYPDRVMNTPISEAGIVGLATGMSMRGLRPVVEIMFGDFLGLAYDQILSNLSKLSWMYNHKVKTPVLIRTPMGGRRGYGPTHSQSIEKLFMGVPGIGMAAPSLFHDPGALLETALYHDAPFLFIENKLDYPRKLYDCANGRFDFWKVDKTDGDFPVVRLSATNFKDDRVTVLTYGGMLTPALEACERLALEEEITTEVIIPSLIKPFGPEQVLLDSVNKTGRLIILEEGTRGWGWGSEVAAMVSEAAFKSLKKPVTRLGALNLPIGTAPSLEDATLPGCETIMKGIRSLA